MQETTRVESHTPHVLIELNVVQLMEPSTSISQVCLHGVYIVTQTQHILMKCTSLYQLYNIYTCIHLSTHTQHYIPHHNTHNYNYTSVCAGSSTTYYLP